VFPDLIVTPWFTLQSYGVCLALAYLVAIELGIRKAERGGEDPHVISNFVLVLVIFAFAGGRALYVWLEWQEKFAGDPMRMFAIWEGGLVFYGGLIGAFSACAAYIFYHGLRPMHLADYAMPSVMIGQAIGRIGCLGVGCCYGAEWSGAWAIHLHGASRHPVQAYAALSLFVGWAILEWLYRSKHRRLPGICLVGYAAYQSWHRYLMETYRVDDRGGTFHFGMTISQEIAVALGLGALLLALGLAKWHWPKFREAAAQAVEDTASGGDAPKSKKKRKGASRPAGKKGS
jgi:phosphatidylglycerol:prolipoprotein diacylglycerol transferase